MGVVGAPALTPMEYECPGGTTPDSVFTEAPGPIPNCVTVTPLTTNEKTALDPFEAE